MTTNYDVIVIGGGHNGLVCAAYLARAGRSVLVLERRDVAGGVLAAPELMPGVPAPGPVHSVGRLDARVAKDLWLDTQGVTMVSPEARLTSIAADGRALTLWADPGKTAAELRLGVRTDGAAYARLDRDLRTMAKFAARLATAAPPDVEKLRVSDLRTALGLFRGYRGMGGRLAHDFLRVLPMPVGDVAADYVEDDQLRAAIAWRGVRYTSLAPSDAGSAQVLLADMVGGDGGVAGEMSVCLGGPAALARGLAKAAQARGAEVRVNAEVARVTIAAGKVTGVVLASGEAISASRVVSGLDPRRTLMELLEPMDLGPTLGWEAANLRQHGGTSAVLFALRDLPLFAAMSAGEAKERLSGRILFGGSINGLDRAADAIKAGKLPQALVLEAVIPTLIDASLVPSAAGNGVGHLMSVLVHGTPYRLREGDWDAGREALGDRVVAQLEAHAPGFAANVVARRVMTPLDFERDYGLTEGHPLHAEPALDQWFAWRPLLGAARYRLPVADGLFLCGSGAHPGGGVTGLPGYLAAREVLGAR